MSEYLFLRLLLQLLVVVFPLRVLFLLLFGDLLLRLFCLLALASFFLFSVHTEFLLAHFLLIGCRICVN
jgi:hypothetical protein